MKTEMSEKDQRLLAILCIVVILFLGIYMGIRPMISKMNKTQEQIDTQQELKETNEMEIQQLPMVQEANKQVKKDTEKLRKSFYEYMSSNEIDKLLTNAALDKNLEVRDLNIQIADMEEAPTAYQYSHKGREDAAAAEDAQKAASDTTTGDSSDADSGDEEADAGAPVIQGVKVATISISLSGKEKQMEKFVDELTKDPYKIRMTTFTKAERDSVSYGDNSDFQTKTEQMMTVGLEIYMYQK